MKDDKVASENILTPPEKMYVGQKAAVFNEKGQVLLLRRSPSSTRPGEWDLCGGALDIGEDPYDAIRREITEETQLSVSDIRVVHVSSYFHDEKSFVVSVYYYATAKTTDVVLHEPEHDQYIWVDKDDVKKYEMPSNYHVTIEKAYAEK